MDYSTMNPDFLTLPDRRLAYQRLHGAAGAPGVVFLGGFASDMTGTKAGYLAEYCAAAGLSFLRFDYRGHGRSDGEFKDGTIGQWFEDSFEAFTRLTDGPQIVVGSSMGGWLALMLAVKAPERLKAVVGIAAAPDFTEDLMWDILTPAQRTQLLSDGLIYDEAAPDISSARSALHAAARGEERAPVTLKLIEEAREHLLLRDPLDIKCPVRLLQGMNDTEVPWQHAIRIAEKITHDDVHVTFVKDGDHRLSRPQDLELLRQTLAACAASGN